jgi:hypothetical protein
LTANAIVVDVRIQSQVDVGRSEYSDKVHLNIGGSQLVAHQIVSIGQNAVNNGKIQIHLEIHTPLQRSGLLPKISAYRPNPEESDR